MSKLPQIRVMCVKALRRRKLSHPKASDTLPKVFPLPLYLSQAMPNCIRAPSNHMTTNLNQAPLRHCAILFIDTYTSLQNFWFLKLVTSSQVGRVKGFRFITLYNTHVNNKQIHKTTRKVLVITNHYMLIPNQHKKQQEQ